VKSYDDSNTAPLISDQNLLTMNIQDDRLYRPKTRETRQVYEGFLAIVQKHMGDVSLEYLRGAADEVLSILKMDTMNDATKKVEIQVILDKMTDETFNQLVVMSQQLIDFDPEEIARAREKDFDFEMNFDPNAEEDEEEIMQVKGGEDEQEEGAASKNQMPESDEEEEAKHEEKVSKETLRFSDVDA